MRFEPTPLPGVVAIEPRRFADERGHFFEVFRHDKFAAAGLDLAFVQDNHSRSRRGVLRGLHAQLEKPQGKLVRAIGGEIFDVAVDIRRGSPTYGRWFGTVLSGDNCRMLWVPVGYAHGFCVLSEWAEVEYKCTALWDPPSEVSIAWNDPAIGVEWPIAAPVLSPKDAAAPPLEEIAARLPRFAAAP